MSGSGSAPATVAEDPLGFFAAEHEKDEREQAAGRRQEKTTFSDLFSDLQSALSPLGKEMKSAATSAADYLLQQSTKAPLSEQQGQGVADSLVDALPTAHVSCDDIPLLSGEQKLMNLKDAYIQLSPGRLVPGTLFMTNFRVAFVPPPSHLLALAKSNPSIYSWLNLPLASIDRVEKEKRPKDQSTRSSSGITIVITCKDVRQHRITTNGTESEIDRAFSTMSAYAFPNDLRYLFAFSHAIPVPSIIKMSDVYDPIQEYSRQGIIDVVVPGASHESLWRISTANKDFRLCKTYPRYLVMPNGLSDDELFSVANFRSGQRLPALSWGDKDSGASMWRSSQPKAGVSGACAQDEKFLELLAQSCVIKKDPLGNRKVVREPLLHIIDCRPRASAMANRATGAGYESQTNYPSTRLEFYNIGNIHVMRDSLKGITNLVLGPSPPSGDIHFSRHVEDTQWLSHLRLILKASWDCAAFVRKGQPVLVHCSHGWDRTAQVCSIAQLFLDSYYRTLDGFQVLVEKEWLAFGHPFELRCAHGQSRASRQDDQMAPVFLQFLDCVWQIVRLFPSYFEFNCRYLMTLADHIYSCRFTTFMFSCEHDREKVGGRAVGVDVWTFIGSNRAVFTSPLFMDPNAENSTTTHVLMPQLSQLLRSVTLWTDYFFRWSPYPLVSPPETLSSLLYDNGVCLPLSPDGNFCDLDVPAIVCADDEWEAQLRIKSGISPSSTSSLVNSSPPTSTSGRTVIQEKGEGESQREELKSVAQEKESDIFFI